MIIKRHVGLGLVVRRLDSATHWINPYPVGKCYKNHAVHWIAIYTLDSITVYPLFKQLGPSRLACWIPEQMIG